MSPNCFLLWSRACGWSQKRLIFLQSKIRFWCCPWGKEKVATFGFCAPHPVRSFINPLEKIIVEPELNEELSWLGKPLCSILCLAWPTWLVVSCQQLPTQKKREMWDNECTTTMADLWQGWVACCLVAREKKLFLETLPFYVKGLWSLWPEECALPSLALERCFQLTLRWWILPVCCLFFFHFVFLRLLWRLGRANTLMSNDLDVCMV